MGSQQEPSGGGGSSIAISGTPSAGQITKWLDETTVIGAALSNTELPTTISRTTITASGVLTGASLQLSSATAPSSATRAVHGNGGSNDIKINSTSSGGIDLTQNGTVIFGFSSALAATINSTFRNSLVGLFGPAINALTSKTTPVTADSFLIQDSAASNAAKQVTYGDLLTTLQAAIGGGAANLCVVYESATQSISADTETVITFSGELVDIGNKHSTSSNTGRITLNKVGYWLVFSIITIETGSTQSNIKHRFALNGTVITPYPAYNSNFSSNTVAVPITNISILQATAITDYAEVRITPRSTTCQVNVTNFGGYSIFGAVYLGS